MLMTKLNFRARTLHHTPPKTLRPVESQHSILEGTGPSIMCKMSLTNLLRRACCTLGTVAVLTYWWLRVVAQPHGVGGRAIVIVPVEINKYAVVTNNLENGIQTGSSWTTKIVSARPNSTLLFSSQTMKWSKRLLGALKNTLPKPFVIRYLFLCQSFRYWSHSLEPFGLFRPYTKYVRRNMHGKRFRLSFVK